MRNITPLFLSISGAFFLWACSADTGPAPTGKGSDDVTEKDSDTKKPASSTPVAAAAPSSTASGPAPASTAPTADGQTPPSACEQACITKFPNGSTQSKDLDDKWDECICQASACAAQCGQTEECKDEGTKLVANDACSQCMDGANAKACDAQEESACTGECASFQSCVDACDGGKND
jgi:hypothetical protein